MEKRITTKHELLKEILLKKHAKITKTFFNNISDDIKNELIKFNFPDCFSYAQKLYHYLHDDYDLNLGLCNVCGKRCSFKNIKTGYYQFCSKECSNKSKNRINKIKQTKLEKYGDPNYVNSKKAKQTCLEKYGNENYRNIEKTKKTCLDRYNCENVFQHEDVKDKIKQTCIETYGCEYTSQIEIKKERTKETWKNKSDFDKKEITEKRNQTNINKFGHVNVNTFGSAEWINNMINKYGVDNPSKLIYVKEKSKQTCLDKYGKESFTQTDEYKDKYKNSEWVNSIVEKRYNTLKLHNTFNMSKIEIQLIDYFNNSNIYFIHQYKSDLYPFNCDFYFPDKDLYVEIQGSWTHGPHPFSDSEEDKLLLEKWKSKNTEYYNNAINTWTIRDVRKREVAQENNLNYLEIFCCNFEFCINEIKKRLE